MLLILGHLLLLSGFQGQPHVELIVIIHIQDDQNQSDCEKEYLFQDRMNLLQQSDESVKTFLAIGIKYCLLIISDPRSVYDLPNSFMSMLNT